MILKGKHADLFMLFPSIQLLACVAFEKSNSRVNLYIFMSFWIFKGYLDFLLRLTAALLEDIWAVIVYILSFLCLNYEI